MALIFYTLICSFFLVSFRVLLNKIVINKYTGVNIKSKNIYDLSFQSWKDFSVDRSPWHIASRYTSYVFWSRLFSVRFGFYIFTHKVRV